jgi:hypothetical protein
MKDLWILWAVLAIVIGLVLMTYVLSYLYGNMHVIEYRDGRFWRKHFNEWIEVLPMRGAL